jgi:hypothetical protein
MTKLQAKTRLLADTDEDAHQLLEDQRSDAENGLDVAEYIDDRPTEERYNQLIDTLDTALYNPRSTIANDTSDFPDMTVADPGEVLVEPQDTLRIDKQILESSSPDTSHLDKGAFHRWLGKSEDQPITESDIKKGLNSKDPHVNKMANFARNARKWK